MDSPRNKARSTRRDAKRCRSRSSSGDKYRRDRTDSRSSLDKLRYSMTFYMNVALQLSAMLTICCTVDNNGRTADAAGEKDKDLYYQITIACYLMAMSKIPIITALVSRVRSYVVADEENNICTEDLNPSEVDAIKKSVLPKLNDLIKRARLAKVIYLRKSLSFEYFRFLSDWTSGLLISQKIIFFR